MRNRSSYFALPYNPKLRDRSRELRKAGNLCEILLWKQLHKNKFKEYDFDRQKIIGNFTVDFFMEIVTPLLKSTEALMKTKFNMITNETAILKT